MSACCLTCMHRKSLTFPSWSHRKLSPYPDSLHAIDRESRRIMLYTSPSMRHLEVSLLSLLSLLTHVAINASRNDHEVSAFSVCGCLLVSQAVLCYSFFFYLLLHNYKYVVHLYLLYSFIIYTIYGLQFSFTVSSIQKSIINGVAGTALTGVYDYRSFILRS